MLPVMKILTNGHISVAVSALGTFDESDQCLIITVGMTVFSASNDNKTIIWMTLPSVCTRLGTDYGWISSNGYAYHN